MLDLKSLVEEYRKRPPLRCRIIEFCRKAPSLRIAIKGALLPHHCDLKKHRHQYRISDNTLSDAYKLLKRCQNKIRQAKDFDSLYCLVWEYKPKKGFKELTTYDTAVRLAAYKGFEPKRVYLHRGTRDGAFALYSQGLLKPKLELRRKTRFLEMDELPKEVQELKPIEIEDVLCVYKDLRLKFARVNSRACYETVATGRPTALPPACHVA
jgi:hypothetical protein